MITLKVFNTPPKKVTCDKCGHTFSTDALEANK